MSGLSRRQFVLSAGAAGLGLVAGCGRWPGQAHAPAKISRVGFLTVGPPVSDSGVGPFAAFLQGLRERDYIAGGNLMIDVRAAEFVEDRLPALADELVRLPVDV